MKLWVSIHTVIFPLETEVFPLKTVIFPFKMMSFLWFSSLKWWVSIQNSDFPAEKRVSIRRAILEVGFESVSGFRFRACVPGFGFRLSAFAFVCPKSSWQVGFGFRLSEVKSISRFRVSAFEFRLSEVKLASRFQVSGLGFGCPKSSWQIGFGFPVSSFGFRESKPTLQTSVSPDHVP